MTPDLSRDSYDRLKHFSRVIQQQGRVQLDADWNEQIDILLHYIRSLAADLLGPAAGPAGPAGHVPGFAISTKASSNDAHKLVDLGIGLGRYYVRGLLCENDLELVDSTFLRQPHHPAADGASFPPFPFLAYLDVWEAAVTALEDPSIREIALGGPDTTARAVIDWRVRIGALAATPAPTDATDVKDILLNDLLPIDHRRQDAAKGPASDKGSVICLLKAKSKTAGTGTHKPCTVHPDAQYRGVKNQLYRVEVHSGGSFVGGPVPTFKWSRENGTVAFTITNLTGQDNQWTATLEDLGRDERFGLFVGDWVEIVDGDPTRDDLPGLFVFDLTSPTSPKLIPGTPARDLLQVIQVDPLVGEVTLFHSVDNSGEPVVPASYDYLFDKSRNLRPILRRWDQKGPKVNQTRTEEHGPAGVIAINDAKLAPNSNDFTFDPSDTSKAHPLGGDWFDLEDGIVVQFQPTTRVASSVQAPGGISYRPVTYRAGDYWLIPARADTGTIIWPDGPVDPSHPDTTEPLALPPRGEGHLYAPLAAVVSVGAASPPGDIVEIRKKITPPVATDR